MDTFPSARSGIPERNKKLINLSRHVLEKVQSSRVTTGNQIAKEIISELSDAVYDVDFKNIQRRVYDALNVLHAMEVITKVRNEIRYKGIADGREISQLSSQISQQSSNVEAKRKVLAESLMHYIALHRLIRKNQASPSKTHVPMPCVLVKSEGPISMHFNPDNSLLLTSSMPLLVNNDVHLLAKMKMHEFSAEELSEDFPTEPILLISNDKDWASSIQAPFFQPSSVKKEQLDYKELYLQIKSCKLE